MAKRKDRHVGRIEKLWQESILEGTGLTPDQAPELLEVGKDTPYRPQMMQIAKDVIAQGGYENDPGAINFAVDELMDVLFPKAA